MKYMRKFAAAIFVGFLLLFLSACGGGGYYGEDVNSDYQYEDFQYEPDYEPRYDDYQGDYYPEEDYYPEDYYYEPDFEPEYEPFYP
jgi:hypothetical protein